MFTFYNNHWYAVLFIIDSEYFTDNVKLFVCCEVQLLIWVPALKNQNYCVESELFR